MFKYRKFLSIACTKQSVMSHIFSGIYNCIGMFMAMVMDFSIKICNKFCFRTNVTISIWFDGFCVTIWEWRQFNECNSLLDDSRIGSCTHALTIILLQKKILIFYANDALDSSQDLNLFDHLGMSWMFYCCCDFHTTATLWYRCIMRKTVHTLNVCIDDQMLIAIFKTNEKKSQLQWHGPVYDTGKMQLLVKLFFLLCIPQR